MNYYVRYEENGTVCSFSEEIHNLEQEIIKLGEENEKLKSDIWDLKSENIETRQKAVILIKRLYKEKMNLLSNNRKCIKLIKDINEYQKHYHIDDIPCAISDILCVHRQILKELGE